MSKEMLMISITNMSVKITNLRLQPHLHGTSDLNCDLF